MVLLSRIYTKGGDKGKTSLGNGQRVLKSDLIIKTIGEVDEANAFIGWAYALSISPIRDILKRIQNDLFDVGADLCMPENGNSQSSKLKITDKQVEKIEALIDELNSSLPPLTSFILPGGTQLGSALHLARTVVRRAEREAVALQNEMAINPNLIKYLNRLSDLLFVIARYANTRLTEGNNEEILWIPGKSTSEP